MKNLPKENKLMTEAVTVDITSSAIPTPGAMDIPYGISPLHLNTQTSPSTNSQTSQSLISPISQSPISPNPPMEMGTEPGSNVDISKLNKKECNSTCSDARMAVGLEILERESTLRRNKHEDAKVRKVEQVWKDMFQRCYGVEYKGTGREKGMLRRVCAEHSERNVSTAIVACFGIYLEDAWYRERGIVPCIKTFIKGFERWLSQGLVIEKYLGGPTWWVVNKAQIDQDTLNSLGNDVLKVDREKGRIWVYRVKDGEIQKSPLSGRI